MVEVDGSFREGGGQILRTALSLSCVLQKPFRMYNIRKGRSKPGLMPQHLTCVRAAQSITNALVTGDVIGSQELSFIPGTVRSDSYIFDVGTAGSTSLVLQTLIPALSFRGTEKSTVQLIGGTHVPCSPSYHYLERVFVPFLRTVGITVNVSIASYGFYPRGGGKIVAHVHPVKTTAPLHIEKRGEITGLTLISGAGNLPLSIAQRQKDAALSWLSPVLKELASPCMSEVLSVPTNGQGTFIFLHAEASHAFAGFTALGAKGKKAETVGREAAEKFHSYYLTGAALDPHLADQAVLYLAMSNKRSLFSTSRVTDHLLTNLWAVSIFHPYTYLLEGEANNPGVIRIAPGGR